MTLRLVTEDDRPPAVRELMDFVAAEVAKFGAEDGDEPAAVALYIRGKETSGVAVMTLLPGFGLDDVCVLGAHLMTQRAVSLDDD